MTLTTEQLHAIFPQCPNPEVWASAISAAWERFHVDSMNARAGTLGIIGNETGGLTVVKRENMNYSPSRARVVFGSMRAGRCVQYCVLDDAGNRVRGDKGEAFTNCIYANMIGNGPPESGDGWRFRGAGIIQLTGRGNFDAAAQGIGVPADEIGDRIETDPAISAAVAMWFMADYVQILPLLDSDSEADFRAGAAKVGHAVDDDRTRLMYRRKALEVLA